VSITDVNNLNWCLPARCRALGSGLCLREGDSIGLHLREGAKADEGGTKGLGGGRPDFDFSQVMCNYWSFCRNESFADIIVLNLDHVNKCSRVQWNHMPWRACKCQ
jgi:hypothetical protein